GIGRRYFVLAQVVEDGGAVGVEQVVGDVHAGRAAEGEGFRFVDALRPAVDQVGYGQPVEDAGNGRPHVVDRGGGARSAAQSPAGGFADKPPSGERSGALGVLELGAEVGGCGVFGGIPVGELDADFVPVAGGCVRVQRGGAGRLVHLHRVGKV